MTEARLRQLLCQRLTDVRIQDVVHLHRSPCSMGKRKGGGGTDEKVDLPSCSETAGPTGVAGRSMPTCPHDDGGRKGDSVTTASTTSARTSGGELQDWIGSYNLPTSSWKAKSADEISGATAADAPAMESSRKKLPEAAIEKNTQRLFETSLPRPAPPPMPKRIPGAPATEGNGKTFAARHPQLGSPRATMSDEAFIEHFHARAMQHVNFERERREISTRETLQKLHATIDHGKKLKDAADQAGLNHRLIEGAIQLRERDRARLRSKYLQSRRNSIHTTSH